MKDQWLSKKKKRRLLKIGIWTTKKTTGKEVCVRLLHNSSHLEGINPVAFGRGKARGAMPLLVHGDAALAGENISVSKLFQLLLQVYYHQLQL